MSVDARKLLTSPGMSVTASWNRPDKINKFISPPPRRLLAFPATQRGSSVAFLPAAADIRLQAHTFPISVQLKSRHPPQTSANTHPSPGRGSCVAPASGTRPTDASCAIVKPYSQRYPHLWKMCETLHLLRNNAVYWLALNTLQAVVS